MRRALFFGQTVSEQRRVWLLHKIEGHEGPQNSAICGREQQKSLDNRDLWTAWRSTQSCLIRSLLEIPGLTGIYREFLQFGAIKSKVGVSRSRHLAGLETKFPTPKTGNLMCTFCKIIVVRE